MSRKSVFLLGQFNDITKEMNRFFSEKFNLQMTGADLELLQNMLKMQNPDLILVNLAGLSEEHLKIFKYLSNFEQSTPVVCIGDDDEQEIFDRFFMRAQFEGMYMPTNLEDIMPVLEAKMDAKKPEEKQESVEQTQKANDVNTNKNSSERKCILLVDDNAIQLRTIRTVLSRDYDIKMATSGEECMLMLDKKKPDLIFLDYEMPGCDGRQTLAMIRERIDLKNIPVVFLTGVRDRQHIEDVMSLNPAGYMIKPADEATLFQTVEKILGK